MALHAFCLKPPGIRPRPEIGHDVRDVALDSTVD